MPAAGRKRCSMKPLVITVLGQNHQRKDWFFDFEGAAFAAFVAALIADLEPLGVAVKLVFNADITITINSYADLLNCIKISSPQDNHHNQCVGHLIGKSERLDIMEDIARAVRRVAFAPETVAPDIEFRKTCHNCGCGC